MAKKQSDEKYSIEEWLEKFGPQYGITNKRYLQRCCSETILVSKNGTKIEHHLPPGWAAEKFTGVGRGFWYIKRTSEPIKIENRLTIAREREKEIIELKKKGFNQREIAMKLEISDSAVSRIIKRIYQNNTAKAATRPKAKGKG